jgi:hypothetical protein
MVVLDGIKMRFKCDNCGAYNSDTNFCYRCNAPEPVSSGGSNWFPFVEINPYIRPAPVQEKKDDVQGEWWEMLLGLLIILACIAGAILWLMAQNPTT